MKKLIIIQTIIAIILINKSFGQNKKDLIANDSLRIVILFNNLPGDTSLKTGPGYSAWIEFGNKIFVFDFGSDFTTLLNNMTKLKIDFKQVSDIFLSHNHWDHLFGVPAIHRAGNPNLKAFIPSSSIKGINQQLPRLQYTLVDSFAELYPRIWTTGEIESGFQNTIISEHSLILEHNDGLIIIVGCAHAGIDNIVSKVKKHFKDSEILLVTGGFHLNNKTPDEILQISIKLKMLGVKKIAPSHCTGNEAIEIFKKEWEMDYIQLFLGDEYLKN